VGTPDTLQMLYVLTCADIIAVGPGAFTDWKEELISELFDRCTLILSGKHGAYHEEERLRSIKQRVAELLPPPDGATDRLVRQAAVDRQLEAFSAYYLTCTSPGRIAEDLSVLQSLAPGEVHVQGTYAADTATVEYRVVTRDQTAADGCFHKMAGVLTAKRLEILSADISTTQDGAVLDSFRVHDRDYSGAIPPERIADVSGALRDVLQGRVTVESLFLRHRRFGSRDQPPPVSNLPMRVVLDNDSSDSRTVIDVFAHDRPGLLYTVARALYELRLSVDLARISTHYDQVVDVFYVRETNGEKAAGEARLNQIRERLSERLEAFERSGFHAFVA
jgi:[protein-PII] uridylyltransferase